MKLPCGIYRTTVALEQVPAGALVSFHNHGDPGPGLYLPRTWRNNRAVFHERGTPVPDLSWASRALEPLLPEGFYRVVGPFFCCASRCQHYDAELLVQLGYNGKAEPILFVPELVDGALALPAEGTIVDDDRLRSLHPLKVPHSGPPPTGGAIH